MRFFVGAPLSYFSLRRELDHPYLHVDRINKVIKEHGSPYNVFFEYSGENISRETNLSVFSFRDDADEPIDLCNFRITKEQERALNHCATLLMEDGSETPKIGFYSADCRGWKQLKGSVE